MFTFLLYILFIYLYCDHLQFHGTVHFPLAVPRCWISCPTKRADCRGSKGFFALACVLGEGLRLNQLFSVYKALGVSFWNYVVRAAQLFGQYRVANCHESISRKTLTTTPSYLAANSSHFICFLKTIKSLIQQEMKVVKCLKVEAKGFFCFCFFGETRRSSKPRRSVGCQHAVYPGFSLARTFTHVEIIADSLLQTHTVS